MAFWKLRRWVLGTITALCTSMSAQASSAYLFFQPPDFRGAPVRGDEPGLAQPMPGATAAELRAHVLWNLRAGLNVAALQCQFSPTLMTVRNYNNLLDQHKAELASAYTALDGYFRRTGGSTWRLKFDQYTTRTYNGFSTLHAQLGFCETASALGRGTLTVPRGQLRDFAENHLREFRNSLVPLGDRIGSMRFYATMKPLPPLAANCWDKKGNFRSNRCSLPVGT